MAEPTVPSEPTPPQEPPKNEPPKPKEPLGPDEKKPLEIFDSVAERTKKLAGQDQIYVTTVRGGFRVITTKAEVTRSTEPGIQQVRQAVDQLSENLNRNLRTIQERAGSLDPGLAQNRTLIEGMVRSLKSAGDLRQAQEFAMQALDVFTRTMRQAEEKVQDQRGNRKRIEEDAHEFGIKTGRSGNQEFGSAGRNFSGETDIAARQLRQHEEGYLDTNVAARNAFDNSLHTLVQKHKPASPIPQS